MGNNFSKNWKWNLQIWEKLARKKIRIPSMGRRNGEKERRERAREGGGRPGKWPGPCQSACARVDCCWAHRERQAQCRVSIGGDGRRRMPRVAEAGEGVLAVPCASREPSQRHPQWHSFWRAACARARAACAPRAPSAVVHTMWTAAHKEPRNLADIFYWLGIDGVSMLSDVELELAIC